MNKPKHLMFVSLFVMMIMLLSACGEKKSEATADEAKPAETTVVLETTSDGGTIEQDSEGNKITKDEKGNILSVEDKDGKPIDVEEYITTHTWVVKDDSSGSAEKSDGSSGENSSGHSDGSGISADSGGKSSSGSGSGSSSISGSSDRDDTVEESIPVIIATIPDDENLEKLPDL